MTPHDPPTNPGDAATREPHTLTRTTDPATSRAGAAAVAPKLSRLLKRTLVIVKQFPLYTARELSAEVKDADSATIRRRLSELVKMGLVRECEPRECRITNQDATTYEAVPDDQIGEVKGKKRNPSRRDMEKWLRHQIDHTVYQYGLNPYQGAEQFEGQEFVIERIVALGRVQALREAAAQFKLDVGGGEGEDHED